MAAMLAELSERDMRAALRALQAASSPPISPVNCSSAASMKDVQPALCSASALSAADRGAFDRHFREHPLVRFHSSHPGGPTQRISDCLTANAFRNSALHADYYRRIGINYVMALPLRIDDANVISVVFNRGHADFNNGERAMLDAVRQPLGAIYRNLVVCDDAGIGLKCISHLAADSGWHMLRVTLAGRILDAAPAALSLLARFFPEHGSGPPAQLPALLFEWFARSRNWGLERPAISHGQEFTLSRRGAKLTVHFVPDLHDSAAGYLLMKGNRLDVRPAHLAQLPVTARECEVLALVAAGKTNVEIAMLLAISARTVQKHLEHIFQKLGVETRTAAAVSALAAADDHIAAGG
jgi:DNA-binding CsgD family transcriptional regulator